MFLNIKNTATEINSELLNYINLNFTNIGFNQIYIVSDTFEKNKEVNIQITGFTNLIPNTICITDAELNANIINWLNTL